MAVGQPILPRNLADPSNQDARERRAIKDFDRRINAIGKEVRRILGEQSYTVVTLNALDINASTYQFQLDQAILSGINAEIERICNLILLEGGEQDLWFMRAYVESAYQQGTGMTVANLTVQSEAYALTKPSLDAVLFSEPYRRRIGLLRAREFELMQGFSQQIKSDLAQTLTRGMIAGQNPRDIAKDIQERTGVNRSRAERIARTEVTSAFRQARMDEAQAAQVELGINTRLMHISALSPSTRPSHRARHSHIYTIQEERDWWAITPNMINCYLPGTKVAGRFKAGSKSYYSGPVVKVVTASGRNFTVTANHPVMTSDGMLPAAKITEGNDLIAYGVKIEDSVRVAALDNEQVSIAVEDVFSALLEVGKSQPIRVTAVDFHGDAEFMDKGVDVVLADRVLTFGCDAKLAQSLDNLALKHADAGFAHANGSLFENLKAVFLTSPMFMSIRNALLPESRIELAGAQEGSFTHTTEFKSAHFEPSVERNPRNSGFFAELKNGFSRYVLGMKSRYVKFICKTWRLDAVLPKPFPHGSTANASDNRKLIEGLAAPVFFDKVVEVTITDFSGHVYDLEEVSGLMVAENLIMSNCKCSTVEIIVNSKGEPLSPGIIERAKRKLG